jgi:hypothetical protein
VKYGYPFFIVVVYDVCGSVFILFVFCVFRGYIIVREFEYERVRIKREKEGDKVSK